METFYFQITTGILFAAKMMITGVVAKRRSVPKGDGIVFAYYLNVRVSHTTFVYFYWKKHKKSMMLASISTNPNI